MGSNNKKLVRALCDLAKAMRFEAEAHRMERFDKSLNSFHSDMMSHFMAPSMPVKNYTDPTPLFKEGQESEEDRKAKFFKLCDMPAELASLLSSNYDEPVTLLEEYFIQAQREADEENSLAKRIQKRREFVERNIADGVPVPISIEIKTIYMIILNHMAENGDRLLWKAIEEYTKSNCDPTTIDEGIRKNLINLEEQLDVPLRDLWPIGFIDKEFVFPNRPMRDLMKITNETVALLRRYTQRVPIEDSQDEDEKDLSAEEILKSLDTFGEIGGEIYTAVNMCFAGTSREKYVERRDHLLASDEWKSGNEELRFVMVCSMIKEHLHDVGPKVFDMLIATIEDESDPKEKLVLYKALHLELAQQPIDHASELGALGLSAEELGYDDGCTVQTALNIDEKRRALVVKCIGILTKTRIAWDQPCRVDSLTLHHQFVQRCNFTILAGLFEGFAGGLYNSKMMSLLETNKYRDASVEDRVGMVARLLAEHLGMSGPSLIRDMLEKIKKSRSYPRNMEYDRVSKSLFGPTFVDFFGDIGVPASKFGYEEDVTIGQMLGFTTKGEFNRLFDEVFSGNKSPD